MVGEQTELRDTSAFLVDFEELFNISTVVRPIGVPRGLHEVLERDDFHSDAFEVDLLHRFEHGLVGDPSQ